MSVLQLLNPKGRKREHILAIDLGSRTTKAVSLQRKQDTFTLNRFSVTDAPNYEKGFSSAVLAEHLKSVLQGLEPKVKLVTLAVGSSEAVLRNTELPLMPVDEMRQMLKFNTQNYLHQDLPDHVFDCYILPPKQARADQPKGAIAKYKVWVGAMKQQLLKEFESAVKAAGYVPDQIALSLLGPVNAFELSEGETFNKGVTALVDLGFKSSSISVIADGELVLSRVVELGGDKVTAGLAEAMGITYAEAEGIKIGMSGEVEAVLQSLLSQLGRELRASIDFFEHQQDRTVSSVYLSGAAARSDFVVQSLQSDLMVTCKRWNPLAGLQMGLPSQQMTEVEQAAPQLAVVVGAAMNLF